jgi:hypothetical protein
MYVFYDKETLKNCFLSSFKVKDTNQWYDFVIYKERNDLLAYVNFLSNVKGEIGYNCVKFDAQVQQWIIDNVKRLILLPTDQITYEIHQYATQVIEKSNNRQFLDFPEWKLYIPQCDPFLINHYDNEAKRTSLKWLQFGMNWKNLVEMNVDHNVGISTQEELANLIDYCHNDVDSTENFYNITKGLTENSEYKGKDQIQLRKDIGKLIGKSVINWNDVKIGEQFNFINYTKATGKSKDELYHDKREAYQQLIYLKNTIPPYITFKTEILTNLLNRIKATSINIGNDTFKESVTIGHSTHNMGLGGIHSNESFRKIVIKPNQILRDADVGGQYPSAIVKRGLYPKHLSPIWNEQIKNNINERSKLKPLAKTNKSAASWSEAYKLANNGGGYGKLGEVTNWQYDMEIMYSVTIGCQLEILMLIEDLELNGISVVSSNTDGIVSLFDKSKEELYNKICKEWEVKTNSTVYGKLEFADYKSLIQASVNDYLAVKLDGSLKYKGDFEIDKLLHKNKSRRIVPLALKAYYVDNILPEEYIRAHKDIFDFCCAVRADSTMSLYTLNGLDYTKQQKTCRYYISNSKDILLKRMKPNPKKKPKMQYDIFGNLDIGVREHQVEAGYHVTLFNRYFDSDNYNINYDYYISKVYSIINNMKDFNIQEKFI